MVCGHLQNINLGRWPSGIDMKMNPELVDRTIIALESLWAELLISQSPDDKHERDKVWELIKYWTEIKEHNYEAFWKAQQ